MKFKAGDKVEFIYRNKKSVGEINGVFPETQVLSIKQSDSPIDLLFSDKAVAKVEEQELVVVPKLVGDFLENYFKEDDHTIHDLLCDLLYDLLTSRDSLDENVYDWIMENNIRNGELLARVWFDGYEVEKEPLYYVKLPYFGYVTNRMDYTLSQSKTDAVMLTESKIKRMDERYWQFAVPVEEVEGEA
ncbi:DUF1642 domain-containing protein [Listeria monocytogenes]|nr:DUF1642 domain-containing protein [Listeria monocytogenes]